MATGGDAELLEETGGEPGTTFVMGATHGHRNSA
jgi:hypothetical protein